MARDDRDILQVLKDELNFVEQGGYGRSVRTPRQSKSTLQDSLTCINYADSERTYPCSDCKLIDFVRPEHHGAEIPCHFIHLNEAGETIEDLEEAGNQARLERELKKWLRLEIQKIEAERANQNVTADAGAADKRRAL